MKHHITKALIEGGPRKPTALKVIVGSSIAALVLIAATSTSHAGFILSGTDSEDHGSATATANLNGWLFMQKAIENLAPGVTNGSKKLVILGSSAGAALDAANSAFNKSSLTLDGWMSVNIDGTVAITNFFNGVGTVNINNAGLIMMDSAQNVTGGATAAELAIFTANSVKLDNFLDTGGAIFSQANDFGWVSALAPGLVITDLGTGGASGALTLTPAGAAAFPGLTNANLSTGPYHNRFSNIGSLPILAINSSSQPVILASAAGSITNPAIPEPSTLLFGLGICGVGMLRRRRNASRVA